MPQSKTLYPDLYRLVAHPKWVKAVALIGLFVTGAVWIGSTIAVQSLAGRGMDMAIAVQSILFGALAAILAGSLLTTVVLLVQTVEDDGQIARVLEYLEQHHVRETDARTTLMRAEISAQVSPVRSLLPLLVLPLLVPFVTGQSTLALNIWALIALVFMSFLLLLVADVHRTYQDGHIRHALVEYLQRMEREKHDQENTIVLAGLLLGGAIAQNEGAPRDDVSTSRDAARTNAASR